MRLIVVSGLSGSGKSIALQTLEDLNYYCVDNLPLELLKPFVQVVLAREGDALRTSAVGIDARNFLDQLDQFPDILTELRALGLNMDVVFLQATDEVLLKRYSETRRKHPLSLEGVSLIDAIRRERRLLEAITAHATLTIDTSHTNVHELRKLLRMRLHDLPPASISLMFESFGYKNGVPVDADFVFDVRCLPNPHWEPPLRALTGLDEPVRAFLGTQPDVAHMTDDIRDFLEKWLPCFETSGRTYLTVAIGCTGGQHRSVYIAAELARHFSQRRRNVLLQHRELTHR